MRAWTRAGYQTRASELPAGGSESTPLTAGSVCGSRRTSITCLSGGVEVYTRTRTGLARGYPTQPRVEGTSAGDLEQVTPQSGRPDHPIRVAERLSNRPLSGMNGSVPVKRRVG